MYIRSQKKGVVFFRPSETMSHLAVIGKNFDNHTSYGCIKIQITVHIKSPYQIDFKDSFFILLSIVQIKWNLSIVVSNGRKICIKRFMGNSWPFEHKNHTVQTKASLFQHEMCYCISSSLCRMKSTFSWQLNFSINSVAKQVEACRETGNILKNLSFFDSSAGIHETLTKTDAQRGGFVRHTPQNDFLHSGQLRRFRNCYHPCTLFSTDLSLGRQVCVFFILACKVTNKEGQPFLWHPQSIMPKGRSFRADGFP